MALCEDESCGLARLTSDDRTLRRLTASGEAKTPQEQGPHSSGQRRFSGGNWPWFA
jgi:hypothetical protein